MSPIKKSDLINAAPEAGDVVVKEEEVDSREDAEAVGPEDPASHQQRPPRKRRRVQLDSERPWRPPPPVPRGSAATAWFEEKQQEYLRTSTRSNLPIDCAGVWPDVLVHVRGIYSVCLYHCDKFLDRLEAGEHEGMAVDDSRRLFEEMNRTLEALGGLQDWMKTHGV